MTEAQRVHIRILETWPRERIRTHTRAERPDAKSAALQRKHRGAIQPMSSEMVRQYAELKRAGTRYIDIKKTLCVSARTMARLRDKAGLAGLLG